MNKLVLNDSAVIVAILVLCKQHFDAMLKEAKEGVPEPTDVSPYIRTVHKRIKKACACIDDGADPLVFSSFAQLTRSGILDIRSSGFTDIFMKLHREELRIALNKLPAKCAKKSASKKHPKKSAKRLVKK